jgi:hypothetical protein
VFIRVHPWLRCSFVGLTISIVPSLHAQRPLPPLPDTTGWGVHVLAVARDAYGAVWVGTYGQGIYWLPAGATAWESIRHDSTKSSISR